LTTKKILTTKRKLNENSLLTILNLVKDSTFNDGGYALLEPINDKYGYEKWEPTNPTFIFEQTTVTELKKYRSVEDFWFTKDGEIIREKMIECNKNSSVFCRLNHKLKSPEKKVKKEKIIESKIYYVNSIDGLNVRDKAGSDGNKIATLTLNDLVYYISKTDKSITINDTDKKTGETKEISVTWVEIRTYNPPKLKGDKILWEDNTENVVGYVFDGFLNKMESSINDHLQGKYYTKKQLSLLNQVEGMWIRNDANDSSKICDFESKYFYSIKPLLNYENENDFYINGKYYVSMYESIFVVESIEYNEENNVFIIGGLPNKGYEAGEYIDELKVTFEGDKLVIDRKPYEDYFKESCTKCNKNNSLKSFILNGVFQGTQKEYSLKDSYGDDLLIKGKPVLIPSIKYKFLIIDNFSIVLKQTSSDDLSSYYYTGSYEVVRNNNDIILFECKFISSDKDNESNPTILIEYSKLNKTYIGKWEGSPDFDLMKINIEGNQVI
jgi:hypothetical protein